MKTVSRFVMTAAIAASMTTGAWAVQEAEAVIVEDLHTGVTTDINGYYKLPVLKPGTYTLKISYVGYAPITRKITVTDKKSQVNNFVMSEGHELKEIEVQGVLSEQRRALQMQKSGMGLTNVVSADQAGKFPDSNIGDALKRISGIGLIAQQSGHLQPQSNNPFDNFAIVLLIAVTTAVITTPQLLFKLPIR